MALLSDGSAHHRRFATRAISQTRQIHAFWRSAKAGPGDGPATCIGYVSPPQTGGDAYFASFKASASTASSPAA